MSTIGCLGMHPIVDMVVYRVFDWHYRAPYTARWYYRVFRNAPDTRLCLIGCPAPYTTTSTIGCLGMRLIVDMVVYRAFDWHYRVPPYRASSNFNSFESLSKQRPIWAHLIGR
ncbi:hypothetical protein GGX14DRAFT_398948 [Mycena pura]|uniref:Uncharacterized protein n=1 Tax=Mycena pura TaxID=153505 RepID=A0AAD6V9G4_9AGAR|nr:hypothetical protein GGX14DRAFT_398948 [Mycena pura]